MSEIKVNSVVNSTGDNDSGLDLATNDQVKVKIANAEDFIFKANSLEVQTGSNIDMNGTELILDADGDTSITSDTDDQVDIKVGGSDKVTMTTTGLGIGTTSPDRLMHVASSDGNLSRFQRTGAFTGSWDVLVGSLTTGDFTIHDNENSKRAIQIDKLTGSSATAFKIHSGGNVSIATTSSGGGSILTLSTGSFTHGIKQFCNNGQTSYHVEVGGATVGSISHTTSSTSYNTSSDYRLKENVVTDWDATTRLKQLKPSRFNFIADADTTLDGFLAHEVSSIVPEAISGEKDAVDKEGNIQPQGIDQSKLVPLLVKTIQELEARITALESK